MSNTVEPAAVGSRKSAPALPALFFISPLGASVSPQLMWLFLLLIAIALTVPLYAELATCGSCSSQTPR